MAYILNKYFTVVVITAANKVGKANYATNKNTLMPQILQDPDSSILKHENCHKYVKLFIR